MSDTSISDGRNLYLVSVTRRVSEVQFLEVHFYVQTNQEIDIHFSVLKKTTCTVISSRTRRDKGGSKASRPAINSW